MSVSQFTEMVMVSSAVNTVTVLIGIVVNNWKLSRLRADMNRFKTVQAGFDGIDQRFDGVDRRFDSMDRQLT